MKIDAFLIRNAPDCGGEFDNLFVTIFYFANIVYSIYNQRINIK
jgi:hypothetical protein